MHNNQFRISDHIIHKKQRSHARRRTRQGYFHRDIKPENLLVTGNVVRLLCLTAEMLGFQEEEVCAGENTFSLGKRFDFFCPKTELNRLSDGA